MQKSLQTRMLLHRPTRYRVVVLTPVPEMTHYLISNPIDPQRGTPS